MENKKYDLESIQKNLFRDAKNIEFEVLDFTPSSDFELKNFPNENNILSKYTATFFCKEKDKCFIYKVIYSVENLNILNDMKSLFKRLEVGARTMFQIKIKTKNPLKYLKDIRIYPIENVD